MIVVVDHSNSRYSSRAELPLVLVLVLVLLVLLVGVATTSSYLLLSAICALLSKAKTAMGKRLVKVGDGGFVDVFHSKPL